MAPVADDGARAIDDFGSAVDRQMNEIVVAHAVGRNLHQRLRPVLDIADIAGGQKQRAGGEIELPRFARVQIEEEFPLLHEGERRVRVVARRDPPVLQYLCATECHAGLPQNRKVILENTSPKGSK